MSHLNVEIKARCATPGKVRQILRERGAECHGIDRQLDTYFIELLEIGEGDLVPESYSDMILRT